MHSKNYLWNIFVLGEYDLQKWLQTCKGGCIEFQIILHWQFMVTKNLDMYSKISHVKWRVFLKVIHPITSWRSRPLVFWWVRWSQWHDQLSNMLWWVQKEIKVHGVYVNSTFIDERNKLKTNYWVIERFDYLIGISLKVSMLLMPFWEAKHLETNNFML